MVLLCSAAQTGPCEARRMPAKRAHRAATTRPTQLRRLGTPTQRCVVAWPCAAAAACTRQEPQADQRFGSGIKRNAPAISTTARTAVTPTIAAFLPLFASSTCADEARRAQAGRRGERGITAGGGRDGPSSSARSTRCCSCRPGRRTILTGPWAAGSAPRRRRGRRRGRPGAASVFAWSEPQTCEAPRRRSSPRQQPRRRRRIAEAFPGTISSCRDAN